MTDRERFVRTLTGRQVDRVPFIKVFGGTNAIRPEWEQDHPGLSREIDRLLKFDGVYRGWGTTPVSFWMTRRGEPEILEDDDRHTVRRYADGMVERLQKGGDYHHQYLEWPVKTRADWERVKEKHLDPDDPERFPSNWAQLVVEYRQRDYPLQLTHGGVYGFARNLMGDENLLYAFYDDPDLVHAIMDGYTDLVLAIWERMVDQVEFDLIEFWEDMASKNGSLVSPALFRAFMRPNYERVAAFARDHRIEILLVDSDGYIDDLAAEMVAAGVTAMYPFEIGAGCDVVAVRQRYPELGMIGGLAKECMIHGRETIDAELERARQYIALGRFIPGPDHFVLSNVTWENYRYFMERLREVVLTTPVG
jgi:uroporphyrinogen decarboxylase